MRHSVGWLFLYGALDGHPFFPSHVASGRCVLSAAAGVPAGVVSASAEPSSALEVVLAVAGVGLRYLLPTSLRVQAVHQMRRFRARGAQLLPPSTCCPGRPPPASPRCRVRGAQLHHLCAWCTWASRAPAWFPGGVVRTSAGGARSFMVDAGGTPQGSIGRGRGKAPSLRPPSLPPATVSLTASAGFCKCRQWHL